MLFADMKGGSPKARKGYSKIQSSCKEAVAHGYQHIWIDTCCIDKSSSAELSEAINSMYTWYQKAKICFAYLVDVPASVEIGEPDSSFAHSRWFRRGWTLQELIAPSDLEFFSREWVNIGTKETLCDILAEITGIDVGIFTADSEIESISIAQRMSWASQRATTRQEDIAYCLMGIFNVNMPLLYGEGKKAFFRLQEEIIKHSDDHSLFAWTDTAASAEYQHGLLAESPANFTDSGNIIQYREWEPTAAYSMNNKGLRMELRLSPYPHKVDAFYAALNCPAPPEYDGFLCILLKRLSTRDDQYVRESIHTLFKVQEQGHLTTIYVRNSATKGLPKFVYPFHVLKLDVASTTGDGDGYKLLKVKGNELVENVDLPKAIVGLNRLNSRPRLISLNCQPLQDVRVFKINKEGNRLTAALLIKPKEGEKFAILLGSTKDFKLGFDITSASDVQDFKALDRSFEPQKVGTFRWLNGFQIRVDANAEASEKFKVYKIKISIDKLHHLQTELIQRGRRGNRVLTERPMRDLNDSEQNSNF